MILVIPANTPAEKFGNGFHPLMNWLRQNAVDPYRVSGKHSLEIRGDNVEGHYFSGLSPTDNATYTPFTAPIVAPMAPELSGYLAARFGASWDGADAIPDNSAHRLQPDEEAAPLDDIAPLIDQLRQARADSKAAKEREDEAKAEILARLKQTGREYGTVAGQRVVHAKSVTSNTFQTVKFRAAHPDLAAEFTEPKTSIRLEIV